MFVISNQIIRIFADDVRNDDLRCFGSKDIYTPNLDQMAVDGIKFISFYVLHGTCTPSRTTLLTGCYDPVVNFTEKGDETRGGVFLSKSEVSFTCKESIIYPHFIGQDWGLPVFGATIQMPTLSNVGKVTYEQLYNG